MSLVSVPFVGTGADTALHVVAGVVLIATIAAACYGFWRVHELPINKAHSKEHQQLGLITALTGLVLSGTGYGYSPSSWPLLIWKKPSSI